jgi:hypothetical protein
VQAAAVFSRLLLLHLILMPLHLLLLLLLSEITKPRHSSILYPEIVV